MVSELDVKGFINSSFYNSLLARIEMNKLVNVSIEEPSMVLLSYDVKKINTAELSISSIEDIISSREELFIHFFDEKLKAFIDEQDEQDRSCQDEKDEVIKRLPFYKNFLIIYMIEFCFLVNQSDLLEAYLKKIKIPNGKKYAGKLKAIFRTIQLNS